VAHDSADRHGGHHHKRRPFVDRHAATYGRFSGLALRWLYRLAAARVAAELPNGGQVLDVGTGPGRLLLELARRRPDAHVVGVDPSADMVRIANGHLQAAGITRQAEARSAGAEDLPFPDGAFDAVVSTLSAHHWADIAPAVAEQSRVLRPGGTLWVFDLRGRSPAQLTEVLRSSFAEGAVTHPRLGFPRDLFLVCHRALK